MEDKVIDLEIADTLLISLQIFIHPAADTNKAIFQCQYEGAYHSVKRAMTGFQTAKRTLEKRTTSIHGLCTKDDGTAYTPAEIQAIIDEVRVKRAA